MNKCLNTGAQKQNNGLLKIRMYKYYNPNPDGKMVGDCVIRAISKAINQDWEKTYVGVATQGLMMHDMPSSNSVWGSFT